LSVNPAGLGVYRSSEFTFTPSLRMNGASSDYVGVSTADNNTHFNINNFGMVLTHASRGSHYDRSAWKAVSFAFGMNRTADFNSNYTYGGNNNTSSASQAFESDANQNPNGVIAENSNTLGAMGYNGFLINKNSSGQYFSTVPIGQNISQLKSLQQNGGVNEYLFSLGGNYKEKLMLGITIGIPSVNYHSNSTYSETVSDNNAATNPNYFSSFNYNQSLDITGAGINAKIGAIYKINDVFRIGAAFHSPTYYSLSEVSHSNLYVNNDSTMISSSYQGAGMRNSFDYNLTTPWKGVLSATILLNNVGFITADYEYVDYSTMQYLYPGGIDNNGNSFQQDQTAINQQIKKTYQAASNFRLGGEAKISKYFMARLGFGYYGNAYTPYGESTATSYYTTQRIDVSGGIGFRFKHFFTDLALVHSMYTGYEQPYSIDYSGVISGVQQTVPTAKIDYSLNNVALTMGVKF
jgi:hypothetical protein